MHQDQPQQRAQNGPHRPPLFVGTEYFATPPDLVRRINSILRSVPVQSLPLRLAGDDLALMMDVFYMHPAAPIKAPHGLEGILVCPTADARNYPDKLHYQCRGFQAIPIGLEPFNFSFGKCISAVTGGADGDMEATYPAQRAKTALRCEIQAQIDAFRETLPKTILCPINNIRVPREVASIDHIHPNTFAVIMHGWLSRCCVPLADLETRVTSDFRMELVDRNLAGSWKAYHRDHAQLRALSKLANRALGDGEAIIKDLAPKDKP